MTADPLAVALAASRPISDAPRQPLEVELLLNESQRAMVGARMANLKHGQMGNGRVDSSMETSTPIVTIERAAELESEGES